MSAFGWLVTTLVPRRCRRCGIRLLQVQAHAVHGFRNHGDHVAVYASRQPEQQEPATEGGDAAAEEGRGGTGGELRGGAAGTRCDRRDWRGGGANSTSVASVCAVLDASSEGRDGVQKEGMETNRRGQNR